MAPYSSHTDEALTALLQTGDEAAFTELYHRYWKLLFSVAANKLNNLTDAEEAVQEVFADLWKRRQEIIIRRSLKSFLAGAVKFQVYILLDKQHRLRNQHLNAPADAYALSAEEQYHAKALKEQLYAAVTQLPERCRLVYELSREAGLSNKEIAGTLNISEKTVENQITKALKHLRTSLKSLFSFLGLL